MAYLMYLRKSRADKEAEARGEGETLARHEKFLTKLAGQRRLEIGAIYKELVSGETISARPKMQQLLIEVMQGMWDGVLVMEIERLARGDTKDQGTVAEAFKFSSTKIVTPNKTYDPNNDFDEEYFEFNLFMSRREYKTINRRIQRGRLSAFNDGWYIAGTAPYGYRKVKHKGDKGYTLEIIEAEAQIIQLIFDLYTKGEIQENGTCRRLGSYQLRDKLNQMCILNGSGKRWSAPSIIDIIRNPIYAGQMRWQWRKVSKKMTNGSLVESRRKDDNCMKVTGNFPAIITQEQFELAQKIRVNQPTSNPKSDNTLQNPLSGLIYCSKCGAQMTRAASNTKLNYPVLRCPNNHCNNISAPVSLIEERLLSGLENWLSEYEFKWNFVEKSQYEDSSRNIKQSVISELEQQILTLDKQILNTYDLLEQEVYTIDIFKERLQVLKKKKGETGEQLQSLKTELILSEQRKKAKHDYIPEVKRILDVYKTIGDVYIKNSMLKNVLERAEYLKTERNKKGQAFQANFELTLFPKLPKSLVK